MEIKKDILENLELRSESVQDILTRPPHWMIRWGNTLIFFIMLMVLLMSYFIKYPEFIPASVVVTSQNPPEKILSRTNSKIEKILVKDHQQVKDGDILIVLQSAAAYEDVLKLRNIIDSTSSNKILHFPLTETSTLKLGELQGDYNAFAKAFQDEKLFTGLQPYAPENIAVNQSIAETKSRLAMTLQQIRLERAKFDLNAENYNRSLSLYNQGVISKLDLENERMKNIQAEQNLRNLSLTVSNLQESIHNLNKTKSGTSINSQKDKINYSSATIQQFEQLRKSLKQWEHNFLIISSTNGIVSFQKFWGENQFVNAGDALLSILPHNKQAIVGRMSVPSINSGKIKSGQKVLIKLDNYRYQEYGIVEGEVAQISLTPDDVGNYYVDIVLPKGLKTSYNKTLPFDKELTGNADIITQDLRLIERFFYQIRKLLGYQI